MWLGPESEIGAFIQKQWGSIHICMFPNAWQTAQKMCASPCVSEMLQMCIVFLLSLHVKGSPSVENAPKTAVMHHAPQKSSGASLGRLLLIGLPYAWRVKTPKTNTCWNVSLPMWRFERGLTLPPMYLCNDGHTLYDLCAFSFWICQNCGIEDTPEWSIQFVSGQTGPCTT